MPARSSVTRLYTRNVISLLRHGANPNQLLAYSPYPLRNFRTIRKTQGRTPKSRPTGKAKDSILENKQTQEMVGLSPKHGYNRTRACLPSGYEPTCETIGLARTNFLFEAKKEVYRTPWDSWRATRQADSEYLEICLAMVRTKAELEDTQEKRESLKRWYTWIQETRASSHDLRVIELTSEIMCASGEALAWISESIPQARHQIPAQDDVVLNRSLRRRDQSSPKPISKTRGPKTNNHKFVKKPLRGASVSKSGSHSSVSANRERRRSPRTRQQ